MDAAIQCKHVEPRVAAAYLKSAVLRNIDMILATECNIPPVPRTVWAAMDAAGTIRGIMVMEQFHDSDPACVALRSDAFEVHKALLEQLPPGRNYNVEVLNDFQSDFARLYPDARPHYEGVHLALMPGTELPPVPQVGEVRQLSAADAPLVDAFDFDPPSVAWCFRAARECPGHFAFFASLSDGRIASFVLFRRNPVGHCAEVHQITTHPEFRNRGVAKGTLAIATRFIRNEGLIPYYSVDARNTASYRTARAVGYQELYRRFGYPITPNEAKP